MDLMQFFDMILHVDKTLGVLLAQYGIYIYAVLFAIVFCETGLVVLFFFPGDTLLFIAGTGVMPSASCMNPTLTGAALSVRIAEQLIKEI